MLTGAVRPLCVLCTKSPSYYWTPNQTSASLFGHTLSRLTQAAQLPWASTSHSAEGRSQFPVFAFFFFSSRSISSGHSKQSANPPGCLVQCFRRTLQGELIPHHPYGYIPSTLLSRSGHRYTASNHKWSVDKTMYGYHSIHTAARGSVALEALNPAMPSKFGRTVHPRQT